MRLPLHLVLLIALLACIQIKVAASEAEAPTQSKCGGCHVMDEPNIDQLTVKERLDRKAPPLYYAGNKFQQKWLVSWLQNPVRIRPAGYFPPDHTISGEQGDVVDEKTLPIHPELTASEAEGIAGYLMTLQPYSNKVDAVDYEPGVISWRMGQLNFGKFNGCDSCHRDAPDYGGVSGPELYTAWQRLQHGFIASFITDPVSWDPHTLMPHTDLNSAVVKKLADYLKVIAEEQQ